MWILRGLNFSLGINVYNSTYILFPNCLFKIRGFPKLLNQIPPRKKNHVKQHIPRKWEGYMLQNIKWIAQSFRTSLSNPSNGWMIATTYSTDLAVELKDFPSLGSSSYLGWRFEPLWYNVQYNIMYIYIYLMYILHHIHIFKSSKSLLKKYIHF